MDVDIRASKEKAETPPDSNFRSKQDISNAGLGHNFQIDFRTVQEFLSSTKDANFVANKAYPVYRDFGKGGSFVRCEMKDANKEYFCNSAFQPEPLPIGLPQNHIYSTLARTTGEKYTSHNSNEDEFFIMRAFR